MPAARINAFPPEDGSLASVQFGAALGAAPFASVEWHAFAQAVEFVERGAAPSAVFAFRCSFSGWLVGVLFPVAVEASGDPVFAGQLACSVAADISCRLGIARVWRREHMRLQLAGVVVGLGRSFGGVLTIVSGGSSCICRTRFIAP